MSTERPKGASDEAVLAMVRQLEAAHPEMPKKALAAKAAERTNRSLEAVLDIMLRSTLTLGG